jgi:4-oxalocrotonate tautomerase
MPFVNIHIVKGVLGLDAEAKKIEISRRVTEVISESAGITPENVWVVFQDIPNTEWHVGYKRVDQIWKENGRQ